MRKGIDISSFQGKVDFGKVKRAGYEFVIIKAGQGTREMDTFKRKEGYLYQPKAEAAGMDWGAYWYSVADTVDAAKREADACAAALEGLRPTYPIYFDQEYEPQILALTNAQRTEIVRVFTDRLRAAGYYPGLYSSTDWLNTKLDAGELGGLELWVADYRSYCGYGKEHGMWQNTVIGKYGVQGKDFWTYGDVPGVAANCDTDVCYKDYPAIIKAGGWNNWPKAEAEKPAKPSGYTADWDEVGKILRDAGITEIAV